DHASAAAHILNTTLNAWALDVSGLGEDERYRLADIPAADTAAVAEPVPAPEAGAEAGTVQARAVAGALPGPEAGAESRAVQARAESGALPGPEAGAQAGAVQ
ncbi:hypothetical protein, partial [Salmonella enterica]|uniref:hypothetical protein n=1 Tax=Salmonella enterica TaxID=28901 RepID=UPI003296B750